MRIEGESLPPCRLCFADSTAHEVEACRVTLDCDALEDPLTRRVEEAAGRAGETLVALALTGTTTRDPRAEPGPVPELP